MSNVSISPCMFDDLGNTPLHHAVKKEHLDVAQFLLEHGANVDARHEPTIGSTPLREVADRCSLRMARLLVDAGANPATPGWMGLSALDKAAVRKRAEGPQVYQLLAQAGASRTSSGGT
jgi:ankyrin repeat protein